MATECALELQQTRTQATIQLTRALYPLEHPLADERTQDTLEASQSVSREQIVAYHAAAIDRSSLVVSLVGDITPETQSKIETYFKRLPRTAVHSTMAEPVVTHNPQFLKTSIPDKASIDYLIGITTGITDAHTDYPALLIGVNVLAHWGGFSGRLMKIVREQEGLTYSVYGRLVGMNFTDGYISIMGSFAPELFDKGRAAIRREILRIVQDGIESMEFKKHLRMFVAHATIVTVESSALARTMHELTVRNKPLSYMKTFSERVAKLTKKEVEHALRKYLILEECTESAAGPV